MPIRGVAVSALTVAVFLLSANGRLDGQSLAAPQERPYGAFSFQDSVSVTVSPGEAFDRFLEVDAWWDHRFSEDPVGFYIEARPGGGFYEVFDESGDGILHATVIAVSRGAFIRLRGPLGLSGYALDGVYSLTFRPRSAGTTVHLDVHGSGEMEEGWARTIQGVWHHFLAERYKPYVEGTLR